MFTPWLTAGIWSLSPVKVAIYKYVNYIKKQRRCWWWNLNLSLPMSIALTQVLLQLHGWELRYNYMQLHFQKIQLQSCTITSPNCNQLQLNYNC